ncbi:conjugative transfer signal peptidase TraF [Rhizobium sp. KAs_5_22]|uniref:conjugative transfer signal peptidase TraF n=1 Tax=Ciceribacter selenitireducens TaxID=448181 RepID=UPI00048F6A23|nr:conjugative transfer signal peptidase TraF [Ciceribacter selenitireducens]PPJ49197.1 conjugative transfer signal peptidase TraF [Rhizobium sp. KAs_5_22]
MKTFAPTDGHLRTRAKRVLAILVLAALGLAIFCAVAFFGGYRINMTPSAPLGLWRIRPVGRPAAVGDLVFICPPDTPEIRIGRERSYLRAGLCAGGVAPLIKTVIATAGQRVEVGQDIRVDGIVIAHSTIAKADAKGRPLSAHPGGVVPDGFVLLHSSFETSYDSRYFGPLPASGVLGLAQEVLTHAP